MNDNYFEEINGNSTLIVSFGGYIFGSVGHFEFMNFLNKHFTQTDKMFLKDTHCSSYHRGVGGISTDVDTTVEFLKTKIQGYTKVLFLCNSGGGYADILFGSLLNVNTVLAFVPQTLLRNPDKDRNYKDIKPFINNTTRYQLYGDTSIKKGTDPHHIRQCERIGNFPNVHITRLEKIDLKELRDNGELKSIILLTLI